LTLGRLFPDYARAQMSLPRRSNENEHDQKTIETWPLKGFEDNDHIVMIGTNWNTSAFEKRARQHSNVEDEYHKSSMTLFHIVIHNTVSIV